MRPDAPPITLADNCVYDISNNETTKPDRCAVLTGRTIRMAVALNDTDPNKVINVPADGVGNTVVPNSTIVTSVGTGVNVLANAECGQLALGTVPSVRGIITNNCDGTVMVKVANGNNLKSIGYHYA